MLVYLTIGLSTVQEKLIKSKWGVHKHIIFRSFKKYTVDAYKDALKKVNFPNYELFNDVNEAYSNFFRKIRIVVDSIAPFKTKMVKANTQKWFDGEVLENINTRGKLFKKFKKSRLHIDKELHRKAKYNTLKLIAAKNEHFFDNKLRKYSKTKRTMGNLKISQHATENTNFKFQCS